MASVRAPVPVPLSAVQVVPPSIVYCSAVIAEPPVAGSAETVSVTSLSAAPVATDQSPAANCAGAVAAAPSTIAAVVASTGVASSTARMYCADLVAESGNG